MPVAARADSEYLAGTLRGSSRIVVSDGSDDEHASSSLRHSEETAVDNPPCHAVPEVGQRSNNDSEVPTAVRGEQSGYVLDEKPSRSKRLSDSGELVEEAAAVSGEPCSSSCDTDVLAGEASAEEIRATYAPGPEPVPWPLLFTLSGGDVPFCGLSRSDVLNPHVSHVLVDGDSGPPMPNDLPPPRVGFAEPQVGHACPVEAEVESADS